jgi:hypothetical protein
MSVLGRILRKAVAAALFHKQQNSEIRIADPHAASRMGSSQCSEEESNESA